MVDRGYERISLDNERSGSIVKQTTQIDAFGKDVQHYTDESVSGSKVPFHLRPAGSRLLADLRRGDRVLVTKIDRAARNVRDLLNLLQTIDEAGASIVFIEQKIDTSGPFGKFMLILLAAIAQLEADIIGERRIESLSVFRQEGRHAVGSAPFGFMSVEREDGRGLVIRPHPENGPILKRAIERVLAGEAQARIVEDLPIKEAGFSVLLRNPRLAGMTPHPDGGVVTIEGEPRIDPEAALLTMSEWSQLREHMKRPDKKPWAYQDGYGAILHCPTCDFRLYKSLGGPSRASNIAYKCGRAKHEKGVPGTSVMVHLADAYIEKHFLDLFGELPVVEMRWSSSEDSKTEALAIAQVRLEAAQEAFLAVETDEEEDKALAQLRAARKALKVAGEMETERSFEPHHTGESVAEAWARADDAERCRMLSAAGKWVVYPGRRPIEEKVVLEQDELLVELRSAAIGEGEGALAGFML